MTRLNVQKKMKERRHVYSAKRDSKECLLALAERKTRFVTALLEEKLPSKLFKENSN